jgi:hypothetical protein
MQRVWVLVFVMACASSPPAATPMAPASNAGAAGNDASCDQAVGKMMDTMTASKPDAPPAAVKQYHDLFVSHCQADAWSPEVRACLAGSKTLDDADQCATKMTDAQRGALDQEMRPAPGASPPPAAQPAATAPAPSPPASSSTRSPTKKSGDPCDGGN